MNARGIPVLLVVALILFCGYKLHDTVHRFDGIVGMTKKNGYGCYCHSSSATPSVAVWISGPSALGEGQEGLYTLRLTRDSMVAGGFNIATEFGVLAVVESTETYWYEDELTHAHPKLVGESDTVSWQFRYRAPDGGGIVDTIFSVANAVNLDTMATDADQWNFGNNFLVHVLGQTSVENDVESEEKAAAFILFPNYPNPFNPRTEIGFRTPESGFVLLRVYDLLGREVATLVNEEQTAGTYKVMWDAAGQGSGVYFYSLHVGNATETKRLVVLK